MSTAISRGVAFWRDLISQRATRKLTVAEACQRAGVSQASFYHWQQRLRNEERKPKTTAKPLSSLLPVKIVDDRWAVITLEMPSGIRLHIPPGCDAVTLQGVLHAVLATTREPA